MTDAKYTPEDFEEAEEYLRNIHSEHFGGVSPTYDKDEQIKHEWVAIFALALAQKVLEPSGEMDDRGLDVGIITPEGGYEYGQPTRVFKAMIEQAVKEIEDGK